MDQLNQALVSIRRILRATEMHGKALRQATGLKTSQLLVLQALEESQELTVGGITAEVHMAQASVTMIVARLETLGFVRRVRGTTDKRNVFVALTDTGREILKQAPEALHQRFADAFEPLETWEKTMLIASLQRVAAMLNAADLDAAPILHFDSPDQLEHTESRE
ncbi:MAG: MarR family transcriptional regulator [Rhodospirillales bacterium]